LAYYDLTDSIQKIVDNHTSTIYLREIYKFDKPMNNHIMKIFSSKEIFIGHSVIMHNNITYE